MQPRTKRQKDVLDFITRYVTRNGYEPSYQQIARQLGVSSKSGIARHIEALETQGLISRRRDNGSFGLELHFTKVDSESVCKIELIEVSEQTVNASEFTRSNIAVPNFLIGSMSPDEVFAFKAPDDSMIDKNICEADIVLFERRSYARRGDIVAALANNKQMLLSQYFQTGSETELRPANPNYESVIFSADRVVVQGIMRGMLRPIASHDE
ncbi:MAG: transcriptional repressor LexA [Pyrinomonadaceae bacterium]